MSRVGQFDVTPAPAGWLAWCVVPGCPWKDRGFDQAEVESMALEHARLVHLVIEPEDAA